MKENIDPIILFHLVPSSNTSKSNDLTYNKSKYFKPKKPPYAVQEARIQPPSNKLLPPVIIPSTDFKTKLSEADLIKQKVDLGEEVAENDVGRADSVKAVDDFQGAACF